MTEPTFRQQPEGLPQRPIWLVSLGTVVISAVLVAIAWLLVIPPTAAERPLQTPSPLERQLFDRAARGRPLRDAGEDRIERYEWIDRAARVARIPIDRAIDAVVADPSLIGARFPVIASKATGEVTGEASGEVGR
jgi:hypothetical protein